MASESSSSHSFLHGGGEMGELVRAYNWAETDLGTPDQWPLSLRTTLGIVLHSAFPMFLFWGKDLTCFYNDAFRPSLGIEGKHSAIGKKGKEVWKDIWDFVGPMIEGVMATGEPVYFEDQLIGYYRNGKKEDIYWTFSYSPAYGDDGQISGVFVTCTETTKQLTTLRKMERSDERLRSVVQSAPFPIGVYVGKEMRIELANQTMIDVWGKGDDVIGKRYAEILPELHNQEIFSQLDHVYSTGNAFHARNQRVDIVKEGNLESFYFNYSFTPLLDNSGKVYGVMNTAADVTDLNLAKQKVEQSEKNIRNMVLQAPVAMCILTGPRHIVEVANDLMLELWGKPTGDVMYKPIFEGLPDAREQGLEAVMSDVYTKGETFKANEMPVVLLRNGKQEAVYQNFVYEPYRDPDGTILGIFAITTDVTEQVLARQKIEEIVAERTRELAAANDNLHRSNAELAQFAYIASHDLQEPVRKVSTFAEMLETTLSNPGERSLSYLGKIRSSAARMHALIRDVLAYSELSTREQPYEKVNLEHIVSDIRTDFELLIEQRKARIETQNLPVLEAIPLHMSQLFGNLISNALKFTRPGISPHVMITAALLTKEEAGAYRLQDPAKTYCRIEVKDNGIGFRPEHTDRIFNIFQRLHGKSDYEGTGIGLALCYKIVQNHHGHIEAISSPGKGSTFVIVLPV